MGKNEINNNLYTKTAYAKLIGESPQLVHYMLKRGDLNTLTINGAVLIKKK